MKLHKRLTIGGENIQFDNEAVSLNLFTPGTASFKILGDVVLSGLVRFYIGSDKNNLKQYFVGYIDGEPNRVSKDYTIVFCRELTALLRGPVPLAMRGCTLVDVLAAIGKQLSLPFNTVGESYSTIEAPYFYSLGNGYHCMDSLADIYDIDKLIWQQQADGSIFVGSWSDSFFSTRPVRVPDNILSGHRLGNRAVLPLASQFRPGVLISGRGVVESVSVQSDEMTINWSADPWKEK